jgi:Carbohydrate binding module (family 6)/Carbohydrate binding module (family 35)
VACASDHYQHVLYGRPAGTPDRYSAVKAGIQATIRRNDAVLTEDSQQAGSVNADYKVLCEAGGQPRIDSFVSSTPFGFANIVAAARAAGFDSPGVNYTIFYDQGDPSGFACGQGSLDADETPSSSNRNNQGGHYAIAYGEGCWYGHTAMHEAGHNMGAVQYNAPNSTGNGWHCRDENDVMCYSDGGDRDTGVFTRCTDFEHFDCGHDDYFSTAAEPSGFLDSHWNIGSPLNRFVVVGGAPQEVGRLEAEDASLAGGAGLATDHGGYSGRGFVAGYGTPGASTSFTVNSQTGGLATLALRYANGTGGDGLSTTRTLGLYVNGARIRQISLPTTGGWDAWSTSTESVNLRPGSNTIAYRYDAGDSANVNLDWLQLRELGSYQLEEGALGGGTKPRTSHTGYTGRGFVAGYESVGTATALDVTADHTGPATLTLRYANSVGSDGQSTTRTLGLYVNGSRVRQISLAPTATWDTWATETENVTLKAGTNRIGYQRDGPDSGRVNLDRVALFQAPPTPTITGTSPGSPANDDNPALHGDLAGGSPAQVKVYRNASCSGTPAATGTAAQFTGAGISVHVATDATTALSARSTDAAGNDSGCSTGVSYTEDSTPPAAPSWTGIQPNSPARDNYPHLSGSAAGAESVTIFEGPGCSGTAAGGGLLQDFVSPGILVAVDDNSTTTFSANASDAAGNTSSCSSSISYEQDSLAPIITPRGAQRQHLHGGRVSVGGFCDERCGLSVRYQVLLYNHGNRHVLGSRGYTPRSWSGRFGPRFLMSNSTIRRLKHPRRGDRIVVRFVLNAADPAGNKATQEYRVQLLR